VSDPEEFQPFRAPPARLGRVREVKSSIIVASIRGLRETGHFDDYAKLLPAAHRESMPLVVAGTWIPIETAVTHYTACQNLGLPPAEIIRMGGAMSVRLGPTLVTAVGAIARTTGMTPWAPLSQFQRTFESRFRGGGGTRVLKLGPREARVEVAGLALAGIPWFRYGYRGTLQTAGRLFAPRLLVTEIPTPAPEDLLAYKVAWT
jgi:hypothetical protein